MKAYLINPFDWTVSEIDSFKGGNLQSIYQLLDCDTIDAVRPEGTTDVIYIDDEGLFKDDQRFFFCKLFPYQSIAGKGLWIGTARDGYDTTPKESIDFVRSVILWQI
ncbi:hypothetical protein FVF58_01150 [Paraburkholderia panacisoli]|uniref:DUF3846 domain-containing protein n=1 Tax=Paraburkholderia panacisoli TaxID=2603818 RepID=A0A5B0HL54_9BURK|nr:hypothetical protein [Paraburkholderia panacisoli]KAA1015988.1 hypothetical protein FVF58_01150 [Paraburkholderia panacisoli]